MLLSLTSYLQQIVSYSYIECILVITHIDCLSFTTRNTLITIETTSPITAIANIVAKAMITILLSPELSSLFTIASVEKMYLHSKLYIIYHI